MRLTLRETGRTFGRAAKWEIDDELIPEVMPALTVALTFSGQAIAQVKELGKGEARSTSFRPGYIERSETDKGYDWVTAFEKESGKVNVKTANTSDEMVSLMNEGGFDLVTASGDASLRLVAGKRVQPINTDLIPSWKTVDDRLKDALVHRRQGALRRSLPVGPEYPDVQHRRLQEAPKSWNVVFEEMNLPDGKSNKGRVQAYDGPIHIADAAELPDVPQAGTRHQGSLRGSTRTSTRQRSGCCARSARWSVATGTMPRSRSTTSRTRAWLLPAPWPYQVNTLDRRQEARRLDRAGRGCHRLG